MRVLIYGGRDFTDAAGAVIFLNEMYISYDMLGYPPSTVISGGARGADSIGESWATLCGIPVEVYKADWEAFGKAAGAIRNQKMLDSGIDLGLEFPGGKGTADMRRRLDKAGIQVTEYEENIYGPRPVLSSTS